ncbi:MAG: glycine oxidase ThiO [Chloroflexi bacterium]|nr:glycine oxidase ThiO [Chloroflexota bacterium]
MSGTPLPAGADVVVAGGGVIGLSLAFELLQRGRSVLVLERDRTGAGATRAAAGMLAAVSEAESETPALVDLAVESHRLYPRFIAAVEAASGESCGFRREGTLIVALGRDDEQELDHLQRAQRDRGLTSLRLTADEVFEREPHLSGWVTGGLLAGDDYQIDPRSLAGALSAAVTRSGGRIVEGAQVAGFEAEGGRLRAVMGSVDGRDFAVKCEAAVVAAGAWSNMVAPPWTTGLSVRPVKGQTVRVHGPRLIRRTLRTPRVYIVPRESGEMVVGATSEEQGYDSTPTAGAVMDLLRQAWHVLPGIYDCQFAEVSTGFRPTARDHLPLLGPLALEGTFVATGHYRHGILLTPVTASLMANLIVEGQVSSLLAPFDPQRLQAESAKGAGR